MHLLAKKALSTFALVALGYALGSSAVFPLAAQEKDAEPVVQGPMSEETRQSLDAALHALNEVMQSLIREKQYVPAIKGVNAFAVTTGGGDMIAALEEGRGVDPETYAGLYAGLAVDEIHEKLGFDDDGRLTYDGNLVRIYPISQLRRSYAARRQILGEE